MQIMLSLPASDKNHALCRPRTPSRTSPTRPQARPAPPLPPARPRPSLRPATPPPAAQLTPPAAACASSLATASPGPAAPSRWAPASPQLTSFIDSKCASGYCQMCGHSIQAARCSFWACGPPEAALYLSPTGITWQICVPGPVLPAWSGRSPCSCHPAAVRSRLGHAQTCQGCHIRAMFTPSLSVGQSSHKTTPTVQLRIAVSCCAGGHLLRGPPALLPQQSACLRHHCRTLPFRQGQRLGEL